MTRNSCEHDDPAQAARRVQTFESPQGQAYRTHIDAQIENGYFAALRVIAVALIVVIVVIASLIAVPWLFGWILDRATADAAIAPMMMRH